MVPDLKNLKASRIALVAKLEETIEDKIKWKKVRDSAASEDISNVVAKAIEDREKKTDELKELIKSVDEYLESITFSAKIRRIRLFEIPFSRKLYGNGTFEVSEKEILVKPSQNKITKSASHEFIIKTGDITGIQSESNSIDFSTSGQGRFIAEFDSYIHCLKFKERLEEFASEDVKLDKTIDDDFRRRVNLAFQKKTSATNILIALNVFIFMLMFLQGYGIFTPNVEMAIGWGANFGALTLNGEWWRLVTSMFLHFGIIHLCLNMLVLHENEALERFFGTVNFLLIYFISGIVGSLTSLLYNPWKTGAGASGAIFGICGAVTALVLNRDLVLPKQFKRILIKGGLSFVAINAALAYFIPFIDKAAHLGGYIGGLTLGALFSTSIFRQSDKKFSHRTFAYSVAVLGLALALGYFYISNDEKIKSEEPVHLADYYYQKANLANDNKDYESALKYSKISSDMGNKWAPNLVGYLVNRGATFEKAPPEAIEWFKLGAKRGNGMATENLAKAYAYQKPRKVSDLEILKLHIDAANLGISSAFNEIQLSLMFFDSSNSNGDLLAAAGYVDSLVSERNPAMLGLKGWMIYHGHGYQSNKVEGEQLITRAFELGDLRSSEELGWMYLRGIGRASDASKAFEYFTAGAKRGDSRSMYSLGLAYRDGLGIAKDKVQSDLWLKKAASLGEKAAEAELAK